MPYITPDEQNRLSFHSLNELGHKINDVGQLTYAVFKIAKDYNENPSFVESYARHAEVIAALENAKEEYRRRFLNPYEVSKLAQNGDVWKA